MKRQMIFSFLSPCGRIDRLAFWWRQIVVSLLFYASTLFYDVCFILARGERLPYLLIDLRRTLTAACLPNMLGMIFGHQQAEDIIEAQTTTSNSLIVRYGEWLAAASGALWLLAAWCSAALILRRLRDTRLGLWGIPLCWGLLLYGIGAEWIMTCYPGEPRHINLFEMALFLALIILPNVIYCLPGKTSEAVETPHDNRAC